MTGDAADARRTAAGRGSMLSCSVLGIGLASGSASPARPATRGSGRRRGVRRGPSSREHRRHHGAGTHLVRRLQPAVDPARMQPAGRSATGPAPAGRACPSPSGRCRPAWQPMQLRLLGQESAVLDLLIGLKPLRAPCRADGRADRTGSAPSRSAAPSRDSSTRAAPAGRVNSATDRLHPRFQLHMRRFP